MANITLEELKARRKELSERANKTLTEMDAIIEDTRKWINESDIRAEEKAKAYVAKKRFKLFG